MNPNRPNYIPPPPVTLPPQMNYLPRMFPPAPSPPPPPPKTNHLMNNFIPLPNPEPTLSHFRSNTGLDQKVFLAEPTNPFTQKSLLYSRYSKRELARAVILTELKMETTEQELKETLTDLGEVHNIWLAELRDSKIAVVDFVEEVSRLFKEGAVFDRENVYKFNHSLFKKLTSQLANDYKELKRRFQQPKELAKLITNKEKLLVGLHSIMSNQPLAFETHCIRVRELWLSNLDIRITEDRLHEVLSPFGQIDLINLYKKDKAFAAVRFRKSESAELVIARRTELNFLTDSINFSDFLKRENIVADNINVVNNKEELTNLIFIGNESNKPLPSKKRMIREIESIGVRVLNMTIRPSTDNKLRHFAIVELKNREEALDVRRHFVINDNSPGQDNRRKRSFNDANSEVNILLVPNVSGDFKTLLVEFMMDKLPDLKDFKFEKEKESKKLKKNIIEISGDIEKDFVWTGFLTQFRKDQTGIDVFNLKGDVSDSLIDTMFNIDIGMRLPIEELEDLDFDKVALVKLSNETYWYKFEIHMDYLAENNQYGVISHIEGYNVYVVPFCKFSRKIHPSLKKTECLALFNVVGNFEVY